MSRARMRNVTGLGLALEWAPPRATQAEGARPLLADAARREVQAADLRQACRFGQYRPAVSTPSCDALRINCTDLDTFVNPATSRPVDFGVGPANT
ncbi:hypothetical protein L227DRAFT_580986 [Lentinus tigrinus ALCF2SS1-6]|uniref:Uncharacterized protein n=1 Tax=Lentinus tigrinus ALCF2SS1-6 TaxID=1328759 RepID=A0A5C2RR95_9APHY|nr:hypothetical protein L227DRAFT_580986 [Lentinus tigrinus ALCF2SS1-6]